MSKPLIWAHRGASGHAPENTLPAFQLAADMGADGVELDVQLTKDGVLVVCHDEKVDRTANAKGWIKDYTFEELRKMDFSYGNLAYEGVQIPTMEEVFDLLEPTGLTINIEMKTGIVMYPQLEEKIVELTNKKGWNDRAIYSSFNHYSVKKIKELNPEAKTGLLYADGPIDMPGYCQKVGADALHPALYNLQFPGFVQECHDKGIDINVWTVNEEAYMKMAEQWGVHAIITNYPDKARKLLG
ncbi:MAG: glycerophosphodiester phosphodiesterase [Lachnospiraceae bacterium]|jgi:glycerophosphoryl diester phosphodiesterase|nr:glycerophosphodiester phosphodiesterase [Lachnospiraceae bacterium]